MRIHFLRQGKGGMSLACLSPFADERHHSWVKRTRYAGTHLQQQVRFMCLRGSRVLKSIPMGNWYSQARI
jgi:hypothetical protein